MRQRRAWCRKASSPSFIEIELTIGLPWTHLSPASITSHFELVDHHRHAGDVGLGGDEVQELGHRRGAESIRPSSMLTSMTWAPFSTWSRATSSAAA